MLSYGAPADMRQDFVETWNALGLVSYNVSALDELLALYDRTVDDVNPRRYHTISHVYACLDRLKVYKNLCDSYHLCAFALWYHDAIYRTDIEYNNSKEHNPPMAGNEISSADYARVVLSRGGLAEPETTIIKAHIMATRHDHVPFLRDSKLVADIDLISLSDAPDLFALNNLNIRAEYAKVLPRQYMEGRIAFFEKLLARGYIYMTLQLSRLHDLEARANIKEEIFRLKDGLKYAKNIEDQTQSLLKGAVSASPPVLEEKEEKEEKQEKPKRKGWRK
jgi:predicted metal-dependent HD superfamily phosphohydrolase